MIDTCEIRAKSAASVFDEGTGRSTPAPGDLIYPEPGRDVGVCKRQSPPGVRAELDAQSGDRDETLSRSQLHIPASAPRIPSGAVVVMLTCPLDPSSVGQRFRVDGPAGKSMATAQRLNVTEVAG